MFCGHALCVWYLPIAVDSFHHPPRLIFGQQPLVLLSLIVAIMGRSSTKSSKQTKKKMAQKPSSHQETTRIKQSLDACLSVLSSIDDLSPIRKVVENEVESMPSSTAKRKLKLAAKALVQAKANITATAKKAAPLASTAIDNIRRKEDVKAKRTKSIEGLPTSENPIETVTRLASNKGKKEVQGRPVHLISKQRFKPLPTQTAFNITKLLQSFPPKNKVSYVPTEVVQLLAPMPAKQRAVTIDGLLSSNLVKVRTKQSIYRVLKLARTGKPLPADFELRDVSLFVCAVVALAATLLAS